MNFNWSAEVQPRVAQLIRQLRMGELDIYFQNKLKWSDCIFFFLFCYSFDFAVQCTVYSSSFYCCPSNSKNRKNILIISMPFVIHATHGPYICKVDENWCAKWIQWFVYHINGSVEMMMDSFVFFYMVSKSVIQRLHFNLREKTFLSISVRLNIHSFWGLESSLYSAFQSDSHSVLSSSWTRFSCIGTWHMENLHSLLLHLSYTIISR